MSTKLFVDCSAGAAPGGIIGVPDHPVPHAANVDSPVILVGAGRSGTSLVSMLFARHPDFAIAGETANLIFGVWYALWLAAGDIPPLVENGRAVRDQDRAGRLVRQTFASTFPDDRPRWMHKPIGVPHAIIDRYADPGSDDAAAQYWRVFRSSFPKARYVSILREPCDVVLSSVAHWKYDQQSLWRPLASLARYLVHPDAPPLHVLSYEGLIAEPEPTVRRLFEAVEAPYDPVVLGAFDTIHVPAADRPDPAAAHFSRRAEWSRLDPAELRPAERRALELTYDQFGCRLTWPDHWPHAADQMPAPPADEPAEAAIARLEARTRQLKIDFERAHMEFASRWREREQEVTRIWSEQQARVAELERAKARLEDQLRHGRSEADRRSAPRSESASN